MGTSVKLLKNYKHEEPGQTPHNAAADLALCGLPTPHNGTGEGLADLVVGDIREKTDFLVTRKTIPSYCTCRMFKR